MKFRRGFWVGLYLGGAYKWNKNVSKQVDNKTYFISLQDQIRNSNFM